MRVLIVASEVFPFAKTGGLADVCGTLPEFLSGLGVEVSVAMPLYRCVLENTQKIDPVLKGLPVELGTHQLTADIFHGRLAKDVDIFFIKRDEFYDRNYLYNSPGGEYFDNASRFIFFCKAIFALSMALNIKWDIIHCHDWQTSLIPVFLKTTYAVEPLFKDLKSILTIHNLGYQGIFPADTFSLTGLPPRLFSVGGLEFWGRVNLLKGGIIFADRITTVSPSYAKEIQTKDFGFGLDGVLRDYAHKLFGILNGVDYSQWDPETDFYLESNFSKENLAGKVECKKDLLNECNLSSGLMERPLIGMVTRLAAQKGIDLLCDAMDDIMKKEVGLIILARGEKKYENVINKFSSRYPEKLAARITFDDYLAHKIEAGSDIFLMPSRYEPCGLNQIYSLKYGTLPIVFNTGGLGDTIIDVEEDKGEGNGFKFYNYSPGGLISVLDRAIRCFADKNLWRKLVVQAMSSDFSWSRAGREYLEVYRELVDNT